jgi:neutrophil factor 2
MSLKAELETWATALKAYDGNDYDLAIEHFEQIADTSKVVWNIGIILATLGRHEEAVKRFEQATRLDVYFTIAYHQKGVSNFVSSTQGRCLCLSVPRRLKLTSDAREVRRSAGRL